MKKLLLLPVFLIVTLLSAQESFQVPQLDCQHKHQFMTAQTNFFLLASIAHAKSMGQQVEEVANFTGELFAKTWNRQEGYEGFVKGMLHNFACFTKEENLQIVEQTDQMIKIRTSNFFPYLKNNGSFFNVTYDEYMTYFKIMISKISNYMGADITIEETADGILTTVKKK